MLNLDEIPKMPKMSKIRDQITKLNGNILPGETPVQHRARIEKRILAVQWHACGLAIKGIAIDTQKNSAAQRIVTMAMKKGPGHALSIAIFNILKSGGHTKEALEFQEATQKGQQTHERGKMLAIDQHGQHLDHEKIKAFAFHLRNDLNNIEPKGKDALMFLVEVNRACALGDSYEDWLLNHWANDFASFALSASSEIHPVIAGMNQYEARNNYSLADRVINMASTNAMVRIPQNEVGHTLSSTIPGHRGSIAKYVLTNNTHAARQEVLLKHKMDNAVQIIALPGGVESIDISTLESAGLAP